VFKAPDPNQTIIRRGPVLISLAIRRLPAVTMAVIFSSEYFGRGDLNPFKNTDWVP